MASALKFLEAEPVYPEQAAQEIASVRGFGAPGEMVSLTFSLRASESIAELELTVSDLTGDPGVIAASYIELHVVKIWPVSGVGVYQSAALLAPELLLKDDRADFADGYRRSFPNLRQLLRLKPAHYYRPPAVRLRGPAITTMRAGQTTQVWISIKVPSSAAPGSYAGRIEVRSAKGSFAPQQLGIALEALPISLLEPEQDLAIWFKATLDRANPAHYTPPALFRAHLQNIFDHGFRSVWLHETKRDLLQQALDSASAVGFKRNFFISPLALPLLAAVDTHGMRPVLYISDEIDARGEPFISKHQANWREVKAQGGETMISLTRQKFMRRLLDPADLGHAPDRVSFYLPHNLEYFRAYAAFPQLRERPTYYYWMSFMEKPNLHRVLAGWYLWKSGASGIAPYCYQHLPRYPFSPFNDFSEWDQREQIGDSPQLLRQHMTTYPAQKGPILTLQWKGLSAGLYDLRYLTTLDAAIKRVADRKTPPALELVGAVQARLQAILARIKLDAIDINSPTNREPYADLNGADYLVFRRTVAQDILLLQNFEAENR